MTEIKTALSPTESIDRIEQYLREWTDASSLPQSLRDERVARVAVHDRCGDQLTIRFGAVAPSKLVRYCDCRAEFLHGAPHNAAPVNAQEFSGGSIVRFTLRGPWNPKVAGLLVLGLLCIQAIYELITGTFDWVTVIIGIVVPSVTAYVAHLNNQMIRKKYRAGTLEMLQSALHIVPNNAAGSTAER